MTTPDNQSPNLIVRVKELAFALNEQLRPQPGQPFPSQKTTLEEDLDRMKLLGGPRTPLDEYVADFVVATKAVGEFFRGPRP